MKIREQGRAQIDVTNADLPQLVADVFRALQQVNEKDPTLFSQNGALRVCEITEGPNGEEVRLVLGVTHAVLRTWLTFHIDFFKTPAPTRNNPTPAPVPALPSRELMDALIEAGEWLGVPELRDVSELPIVTRTGEIVEERGYHPSTQMFLGAMEPIKHLLEDTPPQSHVDRALEILLGDVLGDFEFKEDEDRANALAAILTTPTRYMYECPLPMFLFDSTNPGSGKGTLTAVIGEIAGGAILQPMPDDEDEFRKRIIPALAAPEKVIVFDNVEHTLGGPTLNLLLTSTIFTDRLLSKNAYASLPNNKLWCATGNNISLGRDMPRRCVWVTQDPKQNPQDKTPTDYKHPEIIHWVRDNRKAIWWASLTLVRKWVADGMPKSKVTCDNMTAWAQVVGGILESVGVEGFLRDRLKGGGMDEDALELLEFLTALAPIVGIQEFRSRDVADALQSSSYGSAVLMDALPAKVRKVALQPNGAVHKSVGWYLDRRAGRFAGGSGIRVVKATTWTPRDKLYRLEGVESVSHAGTLQNTGYVA